MADDRTFDAPLENPDHDLLGVVPYAQKLAEFISTVTPPFTIGIYGEWGSGKTSFVNFVHHFLSTSSKLPEVVFVRFSAWPHKTADTLWRALLLCVAKELFKALGQDQNAATQAENQHGETKERDGLRRRLVRGSDKSRIGHGTRCGRRGDHIQRNLDRQPRHQPWRLVRGAPG